jgi:hypothetical protein
MLTQRQATTRVKRGVELLDRVNPDWFKKINLKTFQLDDANLCVLGQVYKDFWQAIEDLAKVPGVKLEKFVSEDDAACDCDYCVQDREYFEPDLDAIYYGFNLDTDGEDTNEQFELLGQTWVRAINRKRQDIIDASRFAA